MKEPLCWAAESCHPVKSGVGAVTEGAGVLAGFVDRFLLLSFPRDFARLLKVRCVTILMSSGGYLVLVHSTIEQLV